MEWQQHSFQHCLALYSSHDGICQSGNWRQRAMSSVHGVQLSMYELTPEVITCNHLVVGDQHLLIIVCREKRQDDVGGKHLRTSQLMKTWLEIQSRGSRCPGGLSASMISASLDGALHNASLQDATRVHAAANQGGQVLEECRKILVGAQPWGALEGHNPAHGHSSCPCKQTHPGQCLGHSNRHHQAVPPHIHTMELQNQ